jgi:hypothetical protein
MRDRGGERLPPPAPSLVTQASAETQAVDEAPWGLLARGLSVEDPGEETVFHPGEAVFRAGARFDRGTER